jgi:hypothetical protein
LQRSWVDVVCRHDVPPKVIMRVEPDEDFIKALDRELQIFNYFIERVMEKIRDTNEVPAPQGTFGVEGGAAGKSGNCSVTPKPGMFATSDLVNAVSPAYGKPVIPALEGTVWLQQNGAGGRQSEGETAFMDMIRKVGPDIREQVAEFAQRGSIHLTLRLNSNTPAIPRTNACPHIPCTVAP